MTERVAYAPHPLAVELLQREHDRRAGAAHSFEHHVHLADVELQNDGRAAERRWRVAIPRACLFGDRKGRAIDRQVDVADCIGGGVQVESELFRLQAVDVEVDRAARVSDD